MLKKLLTILLLCALPLTGAMGEICFPICGRRARTAL